MGNSIFTKIQNHVEHEHLTIAKCYKKIAKGLFDSIMLLIFGSIGIALISLAINISSIVILKIITWLACSVLFYFVALLGFYMICQVTISINEFIKK